MASKHNHISYQYSKLGRLAVISILAILSLFPSQILAVTATVGVYYFEGWYNDTPGAIAAFANAELRNDFPQREPIWGGGLWRGDTVQIMEQQIDLAADHGLAFFSFDWYWYGSPEATENDGINSGLKNFMLASNRDRMKFNINIVDAPPTTIDSDAEWQQVADMLLPYLTDSQYLRVGGNPLITNFNAAGMTQTNYDYFQQVAIGAGLNEVQFAANMAGSTSVYSHVTRYNAVPGWGAGETAMPESARSFPCPCIKRNCHRAVVHQIHMHVGAEFSAPDVYLPFGEDLHEPLIIFLPFFRRRRIAEIRSHATPHIAEESELADDDNIAVHIRHRTVHFPFFIGEHPEAEAFARQKPEIVFVVIFMDAEQNKQTMPDGRDGFIVHGDRTPPDSLHKGDHEDIFNTG